MFKYFSVIVLIILAEAFCNAQQDDVRITRIGLEEGFAQARVTAMTQDSSGFMWIGTIDGLYRYDGYTFKTYRRNPFDSTSLAGNNITQVFGDSQGRLWIISDGGLNCLNIRTNTMKRFRTPVGRKTDPFWGVFHESKNGGITLIGDSVDFLDRESGTFQNIAMPPGRKLSYTLNSFIESNIKSNDFYVSLDTGLYHFNWNTKSKMLIPYRGKQDSLIRRLAIASLTQDEKGVLWLLTKQALYSLDMQSDDVHRFDLPKQLINKKKPLTTFLSYLDNFRTIWCWHMWEEGGVGCFNITTGTFTYLEDILVDGKPDKLSATDQKFNGKNGDIWIVAKDRGIFRKEFRTGKWEHYTHDPGNANSLSGNSVTGFQDRAGAIWLGEYGHGLNKLEVQRRQFTLVNKFSLQDKKEDIRDIRSFYEDMTGKLWIGTLDHRLLTYDRNKLQWEQFFSEFVGSIIPDNPGSPLLWMGTWHDGLLKYDTRTNTYLQYLHNPNIEGSLSGKEVRVILKDHTGTLWAGTWYNGLNKLLPEQQQFKRFQFDSTSEKSLSNNTVYCLYEDRSGEFWVGTAHGLNKYNREEGSFTRYLFNPEKSTTLRNDDIRCITESRSGVLWVGTNGGGLNKLDRERGTFSAITVENGLPNDNIYGILEDAHGNLWLSTNNGLCRYSPETGECKNYDIRDGLQNNEYNTGAYYKNSRGEFFFGGLTGFNIFHPDSILGNTLIPPVYITDVKVYETSVPITGALLTFGYEQDFISFEFVALNYLQSERNQYMIRLDGLDGIWHTIGTRRFASYSHLPPGDYVFSVKGSNNSGLWNPTPAIINFKILPPFWATWWFRGLSLLSVISIGFGTYYWRVSIYKKEQKSQQEFSRQLIENQEQERKRIASDLHDSFGQSIMIIMNHAHLGKKNIDNKESLSKEFDSIINVSTETMEEVRKIIQNLRPIHLDRIGLTKTILSLVEKVGSVSGIQTYNQIEKIDSLIPKEHEINLYRIIQEMLTNIVKHARATEIRVSVLVRDSHIVITVQDNGKGFVVKPTYEHTKNTGFGLAGIKERVNILNGEMNIISMPGEGTAVEVKIPIDRIVRV